MRKPRENIARKKRLRQLYENPIKVGDFVRYTNNMTGQVRIGEVIEEWGVFYACRECTKLLPDIDTSCCRFTEGKLKGKPIPTREIKGTGIFDVKFGWSEILCLNQWWLEKV